MEKTKNKEKNKFVKLLITLKNFWYIILVCVLCFGVAGFFVGRKKSSQSLSFFNQDNYVVLKSNIIISDGSFQDFNQSFNNTCLYFMKSNSVLKDTMASIGDNVSEADLSKIISFKTLDNITNMVEINIKYNTKEESKQILDKYLEYATLYLNKTLKKNMNDDGSFKEGVTEENKIKISQIGNIEYTGYKMNLKNSSSTIIKYTAVCVFLGLVVGVLIIYFMKFYFIIHNPYDVIKNFKLDLICKFNSKKELEEYIANNKTELFCINCKDNLETTENCFTTDEILNNQISEKVKENKLILSLKEDRDSYFLIEKIQLLFKDNIKGFIIYK